MIQVVHKRRFWSQAGFVGIETLIAAGTVGVFMALLLPAIQAAREAAKRTSCDRTLRNIASSLRGYSDDQTTLFSLGSIPDTGEQDGMKYFLLKPKDGVVQIVAEPVPGVTGNQTGVLTIAQTAAGAQSSVQFYPTPGADAGRQRMFEKLTADTLDLISNILPDQRDDYYTAWPPSPGFAQSVFQEFSDSQGLSFRSFQTQAQREPQGSFIAAFWRIVQRDMQLGAFGENWTELPAIQEPPAKPEGPDLLGNDGGHVAIYNASHPSVINTVFTDGSVRSLLTKLWDAKDPAFLAAVDKYAPYMLLRDQVLLKGLFIINAGPMAGSYHPFFIVDRSR